MSLPQAFLDEVRARTSLSALIGKTVRLRKAGNEWQACCPFHDEKSASFYVNDEKEFYHCFGCGAHGDAIRWLQEQRGMEFLDAVRELAAEGGLEMPARDPGQQQRDEEARGLHAIMDRAAAWFADQLAGVDGGEARAYLSRRRVSEESIRTFGLGFAPDSRSRLRSALSDFGDEALIEVGLLVRPDDREPYDRFRGRLMFPIHDHRGRTIAFGGRIIGAGEPKYLNSPDTPLFDKGRTLFNLHRAAPAARKAGRLLTVEGYMDVIGLAQAGVSEVVASSGTALTEAQIGRMWRVAPSPILCFDGDAAGKRASVKAAIRAMPGITGTRTLSFVRLPAGKDPDDIAKEGGSAAVEAVLEKRLSIADVLWDAETAEGPAVTPEARSALRQRLAEHAAVIEDSDLRREYEREFKERLFQAFRPAPPARGKGQPQPRTTPPPDPTGARRKMLTAVLRGLARHPDVLAGRMEQVAALPVVNDIQKAILDQLLDACMAGHPIDAASIDEAFPDDRGWRGLQPSYLNPKTKPAKAEADLGITLDVLNAEVAGAPVDVIVKMARDYAPPAEPEAGKLL